MTSRPITPLRPLALVALALPLALAVGACRDGAPPKHDGATARAWADEGALVLDVRTPEEFAAGHVEGAVNIPVQVLEQRLDELRGVDRVVVYCRTGRRSALAKDLLERDGKEVYDLGPRTAWPGRTDVRGPATP